MVRLRCELTGTNNEAHITLVNNGATKNLIKSIGRLELTERIKGNSGTDFFPVELKLFNREERGGGSAGNRGEGSNLEKGYISASEPKLKKN